MRQILLPLFILCSLAGLGQVQYLGSPTTTVVSRGPFGFALMDTTFTPFQRGVVVHRPQDNALYRAINTTGRKWEKIGAGDGTGGGGGDANKVDSVTFDANRVMYWINGFSYVAGIIPTVASCPSGIFGGIVTGRAGSLVLDVSQATYFINCQQYTYAGGTVTLPAADATLNRWYAIVLNTSGGAQALPGELAENPVQPQVDETQYKFLTYILVTAAATQPADLGIVSVFDQNAGPPTEWTSGTFGTITVNFASTAQSVSGSSSALVSNRSNGSALQFTAGEPLTATTYNTLSFWLRLGASLTNQQNISVQFYSGATAVSNAVTATVNKSATNVWQKIAFTINQFQFSSVTFDRIRIIFAGASTNSLWIDLVELQSGISPQQGGSVGTAQQPWTATDGANNVQINGETFKFVSPDGTAQLAIGNNATHGKHLSIQVDGSNLNVPVENITNLTSILAGTVTSVYARNDSLFAEVNGQEVFVYNALHTNHYSPAFGTTNLTSNSDSVFLVATPTAGVPDSLVNLDANGVIRKYATAGLGGGTGASNWTKNGTTLYPASRENVLLGDTLTAAAAPLHIARKNDGWHTIMQPANFGTNYGAAGTANRFGSGISAFSGVNADGRPNVVALLGGYNAAPQGGREATTDAGAGEYLETHYQIGVPFFERYYQIYTGDGQWYRPLAFYSQKSNGYTFVNSITDNWNWYRRSGVPYAHLSAASDNGSVFSVLSDSAAYQDIILTHTNNFGGRFVIRNSATFANISKEGPASNPSNNRINFNTQRLVLTLPSTSGRSVAIMGDNTLSSQGQVLIGNETTVNPESMAAPHASAAVEIRTTARGFLPSRMTAAQRLAIASPATGLLVFDTDSSSLFQRTATAWQNLFNIATSGDGGGGVGGGGSSNWTLTNGNLWNSNTAGQVFVDSIRIWKGPNTPFRFGSIGIGDSTLRNITTGIQNTAVGDSSMIGLTTGSGNIALGHRAAGSLTTANNNTALGHSALFNTTTGGGNTAVGQGTLSNMTTAINNTAVGTGAMVTATGSNNTAVGNQSLSAVTGGNNTAVGVAAGSNMTSGTDNVAVGVNARAGTTGNFNTVVGGSAFFAGTSATYNTVLGRVAMQQLSTGTGNVAVGGVAGHFISGGGNMTNADSSLFLGFHATANANTQRNQVVIGGSYAISLGTNSTALGNSRTAVTSIAGRTAVNGNANNWATGLSHQSALSEPIAGASLDIKGVNGGLKLPDMTQAQRDALPLGVPLQSVAITAAGSGYTNGTYALSFSGGGGSGAAGFAIVTFNTVTSVNISSWGNGYTSAPTVSLSAGGGTGATFTATIQSNKGLSVFCTDCTATDASTGVMQTWNGSTWKNNW